MHPTTIAALVSFTVAGVATHRELQRMLEWDLYCRALNGATSFCITTQLLGNFCAFGNEVCGSGSVPPYTTSLPTPQPLTTSTPTTTTPTTTTTATTLPPSAWDSLCRELNGPSSFCLTTTLLGTFCAFGNQHCGGVDFPSITTTLVATSTTSTPMHTATITSVTTVHETPTSLRSTTSPEITLDFRPVCDRMCKYLNGPASYCKDWSASPVCQYGNQPCGSLADCQPSSTILSTPTTVTAIITTTTTPTASGIPTVGTTPTITTYTDTATVTVTTTTITTSSETTTATTTTATTTILSISPPATIETQPTSATPTTTIAASATPNCDQMCKELNGAWSYCKSWAVFPVCQGGNQPCGDDSSCSANFGADGTNLEDCSSLCTRLNGRGSYCKIWKDPPTCQGGDQPCGDVQCR